MLHFISIVIQCQKLPDFWITKAPISHKFLVNFMTALQMRVFSTKKAIIHFFASCLHINSYDRQIWPYVHASFVYFIGLPILCCKGVDERG